MENLCRQLFDDIQIYCPNVFISNLASIYSNLYEKYSSNVITDLCSFCGNPNIVAITPLFHESNIDNPCDLQFALCKKCIGNNNVVNINVDKSIDCIDFLIEKMSGNNDVNDKQILVRFMRILLKFCMSKILNYRNNDGKFNVSSIDDLSNDDPSNDNLSVDGPERYLKYLIILNISLSYISPDIEPSFDTNLFSLNLYQNINLINKTISILPKITINVFDINENIENITLIPQQLFNEKSIFTSKLHKYLGSLYDVLINFDKENIGKVVLTGGTLYRCLSIDQKIDDDSGDCDLFINDLCGNFEILFDKLLPKIKEKFPNSEIIISICFNIINIFIKGFNRVIQMINLYKFDYNSFTFEQYVINSFDSSHVKMNLVFIDTVDDTVVDDIDLNISLGSLVTYIYGFITNQFGTYTKARRCRKILTESNLKWPLIYKDKVMSVIKNSDMMKNELKINDVEPPIWSIDISVNSFINLLHKYNEITYSSHSFTCVLYDSPNFNKDIMKYVKEIGKSYDDTDGKVRAHDKNLIIDYDYIPRDEPHIIKYDANELVDGEVEVLPINVKSPPHVPPCIKFLHEEELKTLYYKPDIEHVKFVTDSEEESLQNVIFNEIKNARCKAYLTEKYNYKIKITGPMQKFSLMGILKMFKSLIIDEFNFDDYIKNGSVIFNEYNKLKLTSVCRRKYNQKHVLFPSMLELIPSEKYKFMYGKNALLTMLVPNSFIKNVMINTEKSVLLSKLLYDNAGISSYNLQKYLFGKSCTEDEQIYCIPPDLIHDSAIDINLMKHDYFIQNSNKERNISLIYLLYKYNKYSRYLIDKTEFYTDIVASTNTNFPEKGFSKLYLGVYIMNNLTIQNNIGKRIFLTVSGIHVMTNT